jgi:hypothetical protein
MLAVEAARVARRPQPQPDLLAGVDVEAQEVGAAGEKLGQQGHAPLRQRGRGGVQRGRLEARRSCRVVQSACRMGRCSGCRAGGHPPLDSCPSPCPAARPAPHLAAPHDGLHLARDSDKHLARAPRLGAAGQRADLMDLGAREEGLWVCRGRRPAQLRSGLRAGAAWGRGPSRRACGRGFPPPPARTLKSASASCDCAAGIVAAAVARLRRRAGARRATARAAHTPRPTRPRAAARAPAAAPLRPAVRDLRATQHYPMRLGPAQAAAALLAGRARRSRRGWWWKCRSGEIRYIPK